MKNDQHRAARLGANTGHRHRPAFRNHRGTASADHHESVRRLETLRAVQDVPRFRTRVTMAGTVLRRLNTRRKHGLHVSRCVRQVGLHHEWPDDSDPLAAGRTPALLRDAGVALKTVATTGGPPIDVSKLMAPAGAPRGATMTRSSRRRPHRPPDCYAST